MAVKKFLVTLECKNETWVSFVECDSVESIELPLVPERFEIVKIEEQKEPFEEW